MNIKSLLLGSAAAVVAVSGARAADAVVIAEPEPMEYVRICDTYGVGYYYIPGTETCIRIGGYVRYQIGFGDDAKEYGGLDVIDADGDDSDTYRKNARFSLQVSTAAETELGTLRTYAEARFNYGNSWTDPSTSFVTDADGDPDNGLESGFLVTPGFQSTGSSVSLNYAYIDLAGFRIGKDESAFSAFSGYAGSVIADTLVDYGPFDTNLISYTFSGGNGFSAIVSLEQGSGDYVIDSYMPHVVGGVKFTQGWGGINAVVGYDSNNEDMAAKVRLDLTLSDAFSAFIMGAYGNEEDASFYKNWQENWAVYAGASLVVSEKATINAQVSYDEGEQFGANLNVAYELVPGFTITPEILYYDNGDANLFTDADNDDDDGEIAGIVRFQRSF